MRLLFKARDRKVRKGVWMQTRELSETLTEKFERLVIQKANSRLSEDLIKNITEKFAKKSLSELHDIVGRLYTQKS